MKHIKIITLVLIILAGIFLTTLQINSYAINSKPESTQTITLNSQKEAFDYLPQYLAGQEIIQSLPKNTAIDLKFFDFVNGKRVWLREYSLENGKILEQKWVQVYTVENGLITKMEEFANTAYSEKLFKK